MKCWMSFLKMVLVLYPVVLEPKHFYIIKSIEWWTWVEFVVGVVVVVDGVVGFVVVNLFLYLFLLWRYWP